MKWCLTHNFSMFAMLVWAIWSSRYIVLNYISIETTNRLSHGTCDVLTPNLSNSKSCTFPKAPELKPLEEYGSEVKSVGFEKKALTHHFCCSLNLILVE